MISGSTHILFETRKQDHILVNYLAQQDRLREMVALTGSDAVIALTGEPYAPRSAARRLDLISDRGFLD